MKKPSLIKKSNLGASLLVALALSTGQNAVAQQDVYQQRNLVADIAGNAENTDPNLVNPWGVAFNPFGPVWVANEGTAVATLYNGDGNPFSRVVKIPSPSDSTGGHPTGIVYNGSSDFVISSGDSSAPSRFIFATTEGVIAGWAPDVDPDHAIRVIGSSASSSSDSNGTTSENSSSGNDSTSDSTTSDGSINPNWRGLTTVDEATTERSTADTTDRLYGGSLWGAHTLSGSRSNNPLYTGLAISANGNGSRLYAADFRNNKIDVFDDSFKPVTHDSGAFVDPDLPEDFAPFGIQTINGSIYVTYAKQDETREHDVKGQGLGYVSVFTADGEFIKRVVSGGQLNAPWGIAFAPASFGEFSNHLLVGNFGDGTINVYEIVSGEFAGQLTDANNNPIQIDGLWALAFGNGYANQPLNTLFFSAGPNDEQNGLYGRIDVQRLLDNGNGDNNGVNGNNGSNGNSTNTNHRSDRDKSSRKSGDKQSTAKPTTDTSGKHFADKGKDDKSGKASDSDRKTVTSVRHVIDNGKDDKNVKTRDSDKKTERETKKSSDAKSSLKDTGKKKSQESSSRD